MIAVGLGSARIAARGDDGETAASVTLDTPMTMGDGKDYGLRVRRVVAGAQVTSLYRVATEPGHQATLAFADPPTLEDAPAVGDLCAFGEYDRETLRVRAAPIDSWGDIDGTAAAVTDASVWAKTTDDDPAGSPVWGPWQRIDAVEITARAIGEIECRLSSSDQTFNINVSELRLTAEEVA